MKPGNLSERMLVPNPAATKDEDSIFHAHRIFGVRFLFSAGWLPFMPQTVKRISYL